MAESPKYGYGNTGQWVASGGQPVPKWTDKNAEIDRTVNVIGNRLNAGMDLTQQLAHYKNLTGSDYEFQQKSSGGGGGGTSTINSIYDNQKASQLAALNAAREKAVGLLNQNRKESEAIYQGNRNQADVVSAQNVQKLREVMAANGLGASGENVTANTSLNNARQSAINGLNLQEQQMVNDTNRQIVDLNNPEYETAIVAAVEAQRSQALYNAMMAEQSNNQWQQQFDFSKYQFNQSQQQQNNQFNQSLNFQKEQFKSDEAWRKYTYDNMSASEKSQLEYNKMTFGEDMAWRMYELQYNAKVSTSNNQALINFYKTGKI